MTRCINVCRAAYKETLQKQLKEGMVYFGSQITVCFMKSCGQKLESDIVQ